MAYDKHGQRRALGMDHKLIRLIYRNIKWHNGKCSNFKGFRRAHFAIPFCSRGIHYLVKKSTLDHMSQQEHFQARYTKLKTTSYFRPFYDVSLHYICNKIWLLGWHKKDVWTTAISKAHKLTCLSNHMHPSSCPQVLEATVFLYS